jgi:hypothetical protein
MFQPENVNVQHDAEYVHREAAGRACLGRGCCLYTLPALPAWRQADAHHAADCSQMVDLDIAYVQRPSLWEDIKMSSKYPLLCQCVKVPRCSMLFQVSSNNVHSLCLIVP